MKLIGHQMRGARKNGLPAALLGFKRKPSGDPTINVGKIAEAFTRCVCTNSLHPHSIAQARGAFQ